MLYHFGASERHFSALARFGAKQARLKGRWPPYDLYIYREWQMRDSTPNGGARWCSPQKKSFEKWKKVVSLTDLKEMKTRNDCEIACDCVKLANVVLHVGLCKEIFARKHTATHKPTSADSAHMTTMTHIHTYTHKMAGRHGAPRPPMTDVGTETAFRLEKAQAFPKK